MEKAPKETGDTPLPHKTRPLMDGEVPLEGAAEGRVPQPGPSDGAFDPHRGHGPGGNEQGPVTPAPADAEGQSGETTMSQKSQEHHLPMPYPFHPPGNLPPLEIWPSLKVADRQFAPLLHGFMGNVFLQYGYTFSREAEFNPKGWFAFSPAQRSLRVSLGPVTLGLSWGQGIVIRETFRLPGFLRGRSPGFPIATTRPLLTFELRPQGPFGINTVFNIYYENQWSASLSPGDRVQGTSGVFLSLGIVRIAIAAAVIVATGYALEAVGGSMALVLGTP